MEKVKKDATAFRSKAARIGPMVTGSTAFRPSTIGENPGPGAYSIHTNRKVKRNVQKGMHATMAMVKSYVKPGAPAIPAKHHCYGYSRIENGRVVPDRKAPMEHRQRKVEKKSKSSFGRSKIKHQAEQQQVTPGPGHYQENNNIKSKNQSSMFASNTPQLGSTMCIPKDAPQVGPGSYNIDRRPTTNAFNMKSFGTTSKRSDISATDRCNTPGPGAYRSTNVAPVKPNSSKLLSRSTIGFQATDRRDCLRAIQPDSLPGPGAYQQAQGASTARRSSNFSSATTRVLWHSETYQPGPGNYDTTQFERPRTTSSMFRSSTNRFQPKQHEQASPSIQTMPRYQPIDRVEPRNNPKGKSISFGSTKPRNIFTTESLPGPSDYSITNAKHRKGHKTIGNDSRFKSSVNIHTTGSGEYNQDFEMGKKSYNITFT